MHVDITLPLWAFWDIYGNTSKIRLIGSTKEPVLRFNNLSTPMTSVTLPPQQSLSQEQVSASNNHSAALDPLMPSIANMQHIATSNNPNVSGSTGNSASAILTQDNVMNRPTTTADTVLNTSFGSNSGPSGECTVCYEKVIDCVLYKCGHICMCYDCAIQQWRGRGGGFCPMCRNEISDVIRTYRS